MRDIPSSLSLQIAPMVDWTNSPFRLFMRLMLPRAKLYTEMLVPRAIINHPERFLAHYPVEHPLVLQLGSSCPKELLQAALYAERFGYQEVNLNLGCPSERVQAGAFGACLMKNKALVMDCLHHLQQNLNIKVTAKTRIGVDDFDSYEFFSDFVAGLIETGCKEIIIHARKAWLKGLNPKQNRTIPPIHYETVYRIQEEFPEIDFIINGEIKTLDQVKQHLSFVSGVMIGRLACDNPFALTSIHEHLFPTDIILSRKDLAMEYLEAIQYSHVNLNKISFYFKPLFNLYHGTIYAKRWKQLVQDAFIQKKFDKLVDDIPQLTF